MIAIYCGGHLQRAEREHFFQWQRKRLWALLTGTFSEQLTNEKLFFCLYARKSWGIVFLILRRGRSSESHSWMRAIQRMSRYTLMPSWIERIHLYISWKLISARNVAIKSVLRLPKAKTRGPIRGEAVKGYRLIIRCRALYPGLRI